MINLDALKTKYRDYFVLPKPLPFKDIFNGHVYDAVYVHSLHPVSDLPDDVLGFVGMFQWTDDKITSDDGDTYDPNMLVYAYNICGVSGRFNVSIVVGDAW